MIPVWAYLDEKDRAAFRATVAFLDKRLAEQATINWALRLKPNQKIERAAVEELLIGLGGRVLEEPWATAWRLIEESWSARGNEQGPSTEIYGIQKRLRAGDRSGAIISSIVGLVAPRLKVEPLESWRWLVVKKPYRPKTPGHLLSASLTSGELVDLNVLELANLTDVAFLKALATALESAVNNGLDIGRRLGWGGDWRLLWRLGSLNRVYYVQVGKRVGEKSEPDAHSRGIAPSVKLLDALVARIAALESKAAVHFVLLWRFADSPVSIRLWASAARNPELATTQQVGEFLFDLDDRHFWDLHVFPEIAELRAARFGDLDLGVQKVIARRLRKGPPRDHWPKKAEAEKVKNAKVYWAIRELKRIEVAGGVLPPDERAWVGANIGQFADLAAMTIDNGFPKGPTASWVPPNPDAKYDALSSAARLKALESALSSGRGGWDDDPAERANDWIRQPENADLVVSDMEATGDGGDRFPRVWDRFGWAHSPQRQNTLGALTRDVQAEAERVLGFLNQLSDVTLATAIEGISAWLDSWQKQVVASDLGLPVWLRIWPIAVKATNATSEEADDADLSVTARSGGDDHEPMDLDTLNTPAGKLVGVFIEALRLHSGVQNPFEAGSIQRRMRDSVIEATGRSGLIVRHRLIEHLPFFLQADRAWTNEHLIMPLMNDDEPSLALWRAVARRTHFRDVLEIIGGAMAERATDRRLGRETRRSLVFSLVVECLHAFREQREPAVPNARIQQMLRTLDDEIRASAANVIQQFIGELSSKPIAGEEAPTAADLFRSAAKSFLQNVWPQERSLATPGVSGAFADLPATSGEAFVEAVNAVARFLVPFECWSMVNYGLYGEDGEVKKLALINSEAKAEAFLRLLDLTVGSSEGAVVPYDITEALDQILSVFPQATNSAVYRRLSAAARR